MAAPKVSEGVVHSLPQDFKAAIIGAPQVYKLWEEITPLARNEWICWVEDAKQEKTRAKRIEVGLSKMSSGMRRPCCWPGCSHREKTGKA